MAAPPARGGGALRPPAKDPRARCHGRGARDVGGHAGGPARRPRRRPPPRAAVMETGLGGSPYGPATIAVSCDLTHPSLDPSLADGIVRRLVAYEAHHALRMAGPGYGRSLGEALVSEGLAGCAVRLALGSAPKPWEQASDAGDDLRHLPDPATLATTDYDHAEWFFGGGRLPRWRGYRLGRLLVERWAEQARPSGVAWIHVPAGEVIAGASRSGGRERAEPRSPAPMPTRPIPLSRPRSRRPRPRGRCPTS